MKVLTTLLREKEMSFELIWNEILYSQKIERSVSQFNSDAKESEFQEQYKEPELTTEHLSGYLFQT